MLDPRLYRTGLIVVVLGLIVFAFSLSGQPAPLSPNLAPNVYSSLAVGRLIRSLARAYPNRSPGSRGDGRLADDVAASLRADHFSVHTATVQITTGGGQRAVQTVSATLTGVSPRTIALVAPRDLGGPPQAGVSATAVLLELGQVLAGQTHQDTIVLASTAGSAGAAGTSQLAGSLATGRPDAVIVLGDLVRARPTQPIVVPFSDGQAVAPALLRDTLAQAVGQQTPLHAGWPGLASRLAHEAFPLSDTPQGPFGGAGEPAVLLSLAGQRPGGRSEAVDLSLAGPLGAAVLQTIDALDGGPPLAAPAPYLVLAGQLGPWWAVRLLVLALIIPALMVAVDGGARALRRGAALGGTLAWVLSLSAPFVVVLITVRAAGALSLVSVAPDPVGPGAVALSGGGIALAVLLGLEVLAIGAWLLARPPAGLRAALRGGRAPTFAPGAPRAATPTSGRSASRAQVPAGGRRRAGGGDAGAAALMLVLVALALAMWVLDPLAALLLIPALHLWPWVGERERALPRPAALMLLLGGLVGPALVIAYYVHALGLSVPALVWDGVLSAGGGHLGLAMGLLWSVALGAALASAALLARRPPSARVAVAPVTIRGPVTYAGPGSLGGTESALRR